MIKLTEAREITPYSPTTVTAAEGILPFGCHLRS
jgi:hypothetical protein